MHCFICIKNTFNAMSEQNKKINLEYLTYIKLWSLQTKKVNINKFSLLKKDKYISKKFFLSKFRAILYSKLFNS